MFSPANFFFLKMNDLKIYIIFFVLTAFTVCPVEGHRPLLQKSVPEPQDRKEVNRIWISERQSLSELFLSIQNSQTKNKSPKADAGKNQKLQDTDNDGQEAVELDGSGSEDKDGEIVSYSWIKEGVEIASGVNATVNLPTGKHSVELKVTDNNSAEDTDQVKIQIAKGNGDGEEDDEDEGGGDEDDNDGDDEGDGDDDEEDEDDEENGDGEEDENKEPKAEAGDDQELTDSDYDGQETVQLDGAKSKDKDGEIVSYSWSLNGAEKGTGETAEITLPVGEHTIVLTVTDNGGLSDTDEVEIMIKEGPNRAPVADAGPDQSLTDVARLGQLEVQLDASGSTDPDGTIESYSWTLEGAEIATGIKPVVPLAVGNHLIELIVTDEEGLSDSDQVSISISAPANQAPVADAGADQSLTDVEGQGQLEVQLDGSGSTDPDGNIQSFSWIQDGAEIATGPNPVVSLPIGSHLLVLSVKDNEGMTDTDEVNILISAAPNEPPVANAGVDQELTDADLDGLEVVHLDGSASTDPDENIQSYSWSVNGEEIATGVNATAELALGTTTLVLTVSDAEGLSDSDEVIVTLLEGEEEGGGGEPENVAPLAKAGANLELVDTNKDGQENVVLDASASTDEDGSITSYSWSIEGTEVATGVNPHVMLGIGAHSVLLTVTDNEGATATDEILVTIKEEVDGGGEGEDQRQAFIPNLFSPNGDQMNDRLLVHASGIASLHWRIYNRRGILVYETKEVAEATEVGWEGTTGGEPLPEGSYVWILEASYQDGSPVLVEGEVKGSVTLIR